MITFKTNMRDFLTDVQKEQIKIKQLREGLMSDNFKNKSMEGIEQLGHEEIKNNFMAQRAVGNKKWAAVSGFSESSDYAIWKDRKAAKGTRVWSGNEKLPVIYPSGKNNVGKLTGKMWSKVFNNQFIEVLRHTTRQSISFIFQIRDPMQYQRRTRNYVLGFLARGNDFMFFRQATKNAINNRITKNVKQYIKYLLA